MDVELRLGTRSYFWLALAVGALATQAIITLTTKGIALAAFTDGSGFLLLLLASGIAVLNADRSRQSIRLFWALLAASYGLWTLNLASWVVFGVILGRDRPPYLVTSTTIFLRTVFMLGAVAARPHARVMSRAPYQLTLDFLLLLFSWGFLYAFVVIPYTSETVPVSITYPVFQYFNSLQNVVLLVVLGVAISRVPPEWKRIYQHLFGASASYLLAALVMNMSTIRRGYASGWWDIPFNAAVYWFAWLPVLGRNAAAELEHTSAVETGVPSYTKYAAIAAKLAVAAIPLLGVWEMFRVDQPAAVRTMRLLFVLASMVLLTIVLSIKDHLANRELALDAGLANDQLRLAMQSGKSVAWDWDIKSGWDSWSGDLQTLFGIPGDHYVGHIEDFRQRVHPKDRDTVHKAVERAMQNHEPFAAEFRLLWPDGTVRWVGAAGKFRYSPEGEPERMLGTAVDITGHKLAEDALSSVSRKLIAAQEHERARISRDLHDDIGQRLALLAIGFEHIVQDPRDSASEVLKRIAELRKQTEEIATDVHALSHELHSSKLEYLGIVAAMRGFCKEFSEQQVMEIDFTSHDLPNPLPSPEISLCLFRVLQEALHNASKHSRVRHVEVQLWGSPGEIHLTVSDSGAGFDAQAPREGRGLGLTSMQERLKLVNGELTIESQPQRGTTIHARVPLSSDSNAERAVG